MRIIIKNPSLILRPKVVNSNLINNFIIRNCSSHGNSRNSDTDSNIGNISKEEGDHKTGYHKCNDHNHNQSLVNSSKSISKKIPFLERISKKDLHIQNPNTNRKSNKVFKFIKVLPTGELVDITDKPEITSDFSLIHNPPGQWICKTCNELNFRRRTSCFQCETSIRESLPIFKLQLQDWICTKCLIYNYQNRKVCDGCKSDKHVYRYTV
jgi:hypothetical protein